MIPYRCSQTTLCSCMLLSANNSADFVCVFELQSDNFSADMFVQPSSFSQNQTRIFRGRFNAGRLAHLCKITWTRSEKYCTMLLRHHQLTSFSSVISRSGSLSDGCGQNNRHCLPLSLQSFNESGKYLCHLYSDSNVLAWNNWQKQL